MFVQSLGAALQNVLVGAGEYGLAGYLKGAPLFCPEAVREALDLPPDWEPAFLVLLGYPEASTRSAPRRESTADDLVRALACPTHAMVSSRSTRTRQSTAVVLFTVTLRTYGVGQQATALWMPGFVIHTTCGPRRSLIRRMATRTRTIRRTCDLLEGVNAHDRRFGIDAAHIVSLSMGGGIAQFALDFPERVHRSQLVDSALRLSYSEETSGRIRHR
jgi:hypothetical protein